MFAFYNNNVDLIQFILQLDCTRDVGYLIDVYPIGYYIYCYLIDKYFFYLTMTHKLHTTDDRCLRLRINHSIPFAKINRFGAHYNQYSLTDRYVQ